MNATEQAIAAHLAGSRKYGRLSPDVLERVSRWSAVRGGSLKEAVKRAKRKLHQVSAAYQSAPFSRWMTDLERTDFQDRAAVEQLCLAALQSHVSTAERIDHKDELYARLHELVPQARRVLDLGGGLHPFALPWMPFVVGAEYLHFDLDQPLADLANALLARLNQAGRAHRCDLLGLAPLEPADLALVFKVVPVLEQQETGSALRLLQSLPARVIVFSFPAQSIGGRDKGMRQHYQAVAETLLEGLQTTADVWQFPTETYYVVQRPADESPPPLQAVVVGGEKVETAISIG